MKLRTSQAAISPAILRLLMLFLYAVLLVMSAWMHDDAYITFRTVDNFVQGLGLTWNPAERVQAYTHPLWMFLHAGLYAITREIYLTSLVFSGILSLAVFSLLTFRLASSVWTGVVVGIFLLSSKSFVEYSTSGLENPLTHLLLSTFALLLARVSSGLERRFFDVFLLSTIAALGCLNRLDALLLFLPALGYLLAVGRGWRNIFALALGFTPLLLWEVFSLLYYGSFWPNTAYAKLGIGISRLEFLDQGFSYFLFSLLYDPLTLAVLGLASYLAWRGRGSAPRLLVAGAGLYLSYVLWIGGDYMGGRFLSAPLLGSLSAVAILGIPSPSRKQVVSGLSILSLLLAWSALAPLSRRGLEKNGVSDERQRFYHATGLLNAAFSERPWPDHFFRAKGDYVRANGPRVVVDAYVGFLGFYAGPEIHVVDLLGLPDPLLSRLPGRQQVRGFKPGHVPRPLPAGYLDSLESGENQIADPNLSALYEQIRRVTRGDLFRRGRLADLWELQTGDWRSRVRAYTESNPGDFSAPPEDLRTLFTVDERAVLRSIDE